MITQISLKSILDYDPSSGLFRWLISPSPSVKVGDIAGCLETTGYLRIRIDGRNYAAHRLAIFYITGSWPKDQVDHRNGIRNDNRWENLREATHAQNMHNRCVQKRANIGIKGIRVTEEGNYQARIAIDGKRKTLGTFDNPKLASYVYQIAAIYYHGDFARQA